MEFKQSCYHVKSFEEYWQEIIRNEPLGLMPSVLLDEMKSIAAHAWHSAVINCKNYTNQAMEEHRHSLTKGIGEFDTSPMANGVDYINKRADREPRLIQ